MCSSACVFAKQAASGKPILSAVKNWLKATGNYLKGNTIAPPPTGGHFVYRDPVAEEQSLLAVQKWWREMTRGLSDKPNYHVKDRIAGGILGSAGGYVADEKLRRHDNSMRDVARRLAAAGAGGVAGSVGTNKLMNVFRRYIAETAPVGGYDLGPRRNIGEYLKDLWRFGVQGQQRTDIADTLQKAIDDPKVVGTVMDRAYEQYHSAKAKHELLRRYLGIHTPDVAKDYFVRSPDGHYMFNKKVVRRGSGPFEYLVNAPLRQGIQDIENAPRYSPRSEFNPFNMVFGSHDMRNNGPIRQRLGYREGRYTIGDAWNFAIDPHETDIKKYLLGLARTSPQRWKEYLQRPLSSATESTIAGMSGGTVGDRLGSVALRQLMEKVFRQHTPVFQQPIILRFPSNLKDRIPAPISYTRMQGTVPPTMTPVIDAVI
jgi:hypothetical protein